MSNEIDVPLAWWFYRMYHPELAIPIMSIDSKRQHDGPESQPKRCKVVLSKRPHDEEGLSSKRRKK